MSRRFSLLFGFFMVAFYVFLSFFIALFVKNSLVVMFIVDVIIFIICFYYYRKQHYSDVIDFAKPELLSMYAIIFFCWFVVQITASAYYTYYGDASFDAYAKAVQSEIIVRIILALVVAPLMEEVLFRGVLFNAMKRYSLPLAYVGSSLVFALLHGTVLHLYVAFVMGLAFALIYQYTGKLRYSVLAHVFANLLTLVFSAMVLPAVVTSFWFVIVSDLALTVILVYWYGFNRKRAQNRNMEHIDTSVASDVV